MISIGAVCRFQSFLKTPINTTTEGRGEAYNCQHNQRDFNAGTPAGLFLCQTWYNLHRAHYLQKCVPIKTHTLKGDSSFSKDSNFSVHDFSQLKVQKYSNSNEIFYGINISPYTGEFDASLRKGFTKDQGRIIMFCKFKRKSVQGE